MNKNTKTPKLSIAMLGHKRVPSREGGIEIVVEELSKRMVSLGHDVTCYNRMGHHVSGSQFDSDMDLTYYHSVRIKNVPSLNFKGLAAVSASFFAAFIIAFKRFDVVHFHAEGPCAALWFPKLFGKKCVATIHGIDWKRAKWGKFARWYIRLGEKVAARYADEIIVLSKNVQLYFKETYNRDTVYIPNGVVRPTILNCDLIGNKFLLKKNGYILFLGRLVPEKGVSYLIKAFRQVNSDLKLVIAGGSSDSSDYVEELKILAMSDQRVIFTGFVQGRMLEELYSNAYLYVLPSDLEGMPLSLLEALSYGNCCLVSDIPECTEVAENHVMIFRRSDINDLRDKLQFACNNQDIVEEYKSRSSDYICKKYNWDEVVKKTLDVYNRTE